MDAPNHALIERFFGKDSEQYNRLHQPIIDNHSNGEIRIRPNKNRQILFICAILKCCSDTIRLKGIYSRRPLIRYFNFVFPAIAVLMLLAAAYFFFVEGHIHQANKIQSKPLLIHASSKEIKKSPFAHNLNITGKH
jgi:hypothetical protein